MYNTISRLARLFVLPEHYMKAHYETINGIQTSIEQLEGVVIAFFDDEIEFFQTWEEGEKWIEKNVSKLCTDSDLF